MSLLYISENNAVLGINENRLQVKYKDGMIRLIPIETLEGITLLGNSQLTTQCVEICLQKGIPVSYFSKGGRYFGRLISTGHVKASLQRKQSSLYETAFSTELSRLWIKAKIKNQIVVLRRYAKSREVDVKDEVQNMEFCMDRLERSTDISELMGHEGQAAKSYFAGLSKCIEEEFVFHGRSRRPPMDEFNSLISLGYSILMNEVYSAIEAKGMNPYFGFMHRDADKHPTLASDLIEEWRAVLIDSLAMSMINGHELLKNDFVMNIDEPGCFLAKEGLRKYLRKLDEKLQTKTKYLSYVDYSVSFRSAIALQAEQLVKAIEAGDASLYHPVVIR